MMAELLGHVSNVVTFGDPQGCVCDMIDNTIGVIRAGNLPPKAQNIKKANKLSKSKP